MGDLIFIQEGGSELAMLRAPKTAAEVLKALRRHGDLTDEREFCCVTAIPWRQDAMPLSRLMLLRQQPRHSHL